MNVRRARLGLCLLMACIYGTLGTVHEITRAVRGAGMLRVFIALGFLVPAVLGARALVQRGLQHERRTWLVLGGAASVYALTMWWASTLEETLHLIEYGVVGLLARASVPPSWTPTRAWLGGWLGAVVLGAMDEAIQGWLPNRTGDVADIGLNALAAALPLVVAFLLSRDPRGPADVELTSELTLVADEP